jgi:hypothetical protein
VPELRGVKFGGRGISQFGPNTHYNEMKLARSVNEPGCERVWPKRATVNGLTSVAGSQSARLQALHEVLAC